MTQDNPQIALARQIIETTDTHLFLTGKAGTGKTTFLRRLRQDKPKRMVVLAPTGIAAINAEGVTIHSFFQLSFAPFFPGAQMPQNNTFAINKQKMRLIRSLDLLVIDEISMVRADLLDAVDATLRRIRRNTQPFGGVQLLLIGDLQQLAPVVREDEWPMLSRYYDTPFFFSSQALRRTHYVTVELTKVYRQSDQHFLNLLNAIREGRADNQVLQQLNTRCLPADAPSPYQDAVRLVTHNHQAQAINQAELAKLSGKEYTYAAKVEGKFPETSFPVDEALTLKEGARVMFVKNDVNKTYFNGMLGNVIAIGERNFTVQPVDTEKEPIIVHPERWENTRYGLDEKTGEIKEIVEGTFVQFPIKPAWAITIHKSQGLTFDHVEIDASAAFAAGQTYVALSRCRTLEGIVLSRPLTPDAIIADEKVTAFQSQARAEEVTHERLNQMRNEYALHLLTELFTFIKERAALAGIHRQFEEHLYRTYSRTSQRCEAEVKLFDAHVVNVSSTFHRQYSQLIALAGGDLSDSALQERVKKGSAYFADRLELLRDFVRETDVEVDNREVRQRITTLRQELSAELSLHTRLLRFVAKEGLVTKEYLSLRARLLIEQDREADPKSARQGKTTHQRTDKISVPEEVTNQALYKRLLQWRRDKAEELSVPAYVVLQTKAIIAMANAQPQTREDLAKIPYFGKASMERYGEELLSILAE